MCGIAGYITDGEPVANGALIRAMCDRIRHRGPDGEGYFVDGTVALGHRRLSIIDVAGGMQPLGNEDGTLQVIFNGEIYNYRELREDLLKRGHRFTTHSDTEVLVHLYEEVGERLPEHLNGMFALAIWDRRRQELFLARDRFGEKPLYYACSAPGMRFAFASELKALRMIPSFPARVNPRSVSEFLAVGYVPDPDTIYQDVFKLKPGHSLTVRSSGMRMRRYWEPSFQIDETSDFDRSLESVRDLAEDAVERRMISDVPLGAFLSGGVDSSSVVAFMSRRAPGQVKTFSIGFTNKKFDETHFARLVAERYRTEHHEQIVSPEIAEVLDTLVEHYDEPFGDSSAIPTLYLAQMTRRHVTVALSGDGADELFGGYRRYFFGVLEQRLRTLFPRWFRRTAIRMGARWYPKFDYLPQVFRAKSLLRGLSQELADAYCASMRGFGDEQLDAVLSPELRTHRDAVRDRFRNAFDAVHHLPPLQQMQAVDLETYLPGDILVKMDRATMAHSLEARAPMLDHRLAELAASLPARFKLQGNNGKHILKKAVEPYLPAAVITRRKAGFSVPLAQWFRTSLKPVFESSVTNRDMEEFVNLVEVRRLWKEHQSGLHNHDRKLWHLLMLAQWREHHLKPQAVAAVADAVAR